MPITFTGLQALSVRRDNRLDRDTVLARSRARCFRDRRYWSARPGAGSTSVGDMDPEHRRSQSSHLIMDSLDYKDAIISSTIKNISYQQQIILKESGLQASQASPKQKQEEPSSAKADSECSMTLEYNYEYNTTKKDTE